MVRSHGSLTYTQMLTITSSYLHEIRKVQTSICTYCRTAMDIGLHIMLHYPVWAEQREKILKMIEIRRNYEAMPS